MYKQYQWLRSYRRAQYYWDRSFSKCEEAIGGAPSKVCRLVPLFFNFCFFTNVMTFNIFLQIARLVLLKLLKCEAIHLTFKLLEKTHFFFYLIMFSTRSVTWGSDLFNGPSNCEFFLTGNGETQT